MRRLALAGIVLECTLCLAALVIGLVYPSARTLTVGAVGRGAAVAALGYYASKGSDTARVILVILEVGTAATGLLLLALILGRPADGNRMTGVLLCAALVVVYGTFGVAIALGFRPRTE